MRAARASSPACTAACTGSAFSSCPSSCFSSTCWTCSTSAAPSRTSAAAIESEARGARARASPFDGDTFARVRRHSFSSCSCSSTCTPRRTHTALRAGAPRAARSRAAPAPARAADGLAAAHAAAAARAAAHIRGSGADDPRVHESGPSPSTLIRMIHYRLGGPPRGATTLRSVCSDVVPSDHI